ncbi:J domain-containing protein [Sphingomonas sp. ID1715]|uniref:J domain-containing protein n=1 Tax=Sphingomonas sp. ID1715 TaxID=1656898 RepID=UPI0014899E81|nr:J domain-containing protein [Sphingomonas sp. ID1715]NNM76910.1 J domain-containing protein [Sphingomonas sp. ID1715]
MLKLLVVAGVIVWLLFWLKGNQQRRRDFMPLSEARALLGVGDTDDAETIRAAHRRIIARVHPDSGGTPELARRTNLARDILLAELARDRND